MHAIPSKAQSVQVSNSQPRYDESGKIVDAHDGRVIQFGDTFYWYGTSYDTTNGFTTFNHYVCYSSEDLIHWKKEGRLLPNQAEGVYYRPHVIYNELTQKYVLWYNWYPQLWDGQFGVAVSDTPTGPFEVLNDNVAMANTSLGLGDFGLFVDDDRTAYLSYNTIDGHRVSVERLDSAYTASTLDNGGFIAEHMEAGSMFKRRGKYYLLTDYTCCFCNYGSGARVYISDHPLSGYTFTGNINRYPGRPALWLTDGIAQGNVLAGLVKEDSSYQSVELRFDTLATFNQVELTLFTGNRPENCGDVDNPRVHPRFVTPTFTLFAWQNGTWRELATNKPSVNRRALNEVLTWELPEPIKTGRIKIEPQPDYVFDQIYVSEATVTSSGASSPTQPAQAYVTGPRVAQAPIIPAQQTYIMTLPTAPDTTYVWMGDLWGSASDGVKGHDYQYWTPLEFREDGTLQPLEWEDEWTVTLPE